MIKVARREWLAYIQAAHPKSVTRSKAKIHTVSPWPTAPEFPLLSEAG